MTAAHGRLEHAIAAGDLLVIDTSATLAYLVGTERASGAAAFVFDGCIGTSRNPALLSTVTAAELLVRPFRAGRAALATVEGFLQFFGELRLAEVTYAVAREAARIRAATGLSMPDALIVATAVESGAQLLVTNDGQWATAVDALGLPVRVLRLTDFEAGDKAADESVAEDPAADRVTASGGKRPSSRRC